MIEYLNQIDRIILRKKENLMSVWSDTLAN
jgi:hypothetical protein